MKKINLIIALTLVVSAISTQAQTVQWADKVISYSSQFAPRQYSADQILGKPNVLPNLGASPNAWTPKKKNREEFIQVGFEICHAHSPDCHRRNNATREYQGNLCL